MEYSSSMSSIQALADDVKQELFSTDDIYSFVSPSPYDTAWLAMVPDPKQGDGEPMFKACLDWVVTNQKDEGFWGEYSRDLDGLQRPTIDSLPATLACMVVLKKWNVGEQNIEKGMEFIHRNMEMLLEVQYEGCPRWFTIVFPAMIELAQATGLEIICPEKLKGTLLDIFYNRQQILEMEELVDGQHYPPLLSYMEAWPSTYKIDNDCIMRHLSDDGSLFQSPSATARALMATGSQKCLDYLKNLVQRCGHAVPSIYPMDEELVKLCMINQIQRLGLGEVFREEIEQMLSQIYRSYMKQESSETKKKPVAEAQIYKDSLAFRLLRMQGYNVAPCTFCWFLRDEESLVDMEEKYEMFSSAMYNVYRATDIMFPGEYAAEAARSFSRKLLEKTMTLRTIHDSLVVFPNFKKLIKHELTVPWIARLSHLDHRKWIELAEVHTQWIGKASIYRLSCIDNDKLIKLAAKSYEFRQSVYRNELEELKRWSKGWGLSEMGFGREKTTYCYFAVASSICLPHNSPIRMIVAKSAILITVADDFFDMEGSLNELLTLTQAVQRWDGRGLKGHGKIIFDALDNLVSDITTRHLGAQGEDITGWLQDLWRETFGSWMRESRWSSSGDIASKAEYLETGMTSIAAHTLVLPASRFLTPSLPLHKLAPPHYQTVTKLLMAISRLLNDIQSYQKEQADGKTNFVLLHLIENPQADMDDSIAYVKEILDGMRKEFLQHVLMEGFSDLPKPCKRLHLSCLKVFQMFFNSTNLFDSKADLLQDIMKAIYIPLEHQPSEPDLKPVQPLPAVMIQSRPKKENLIISAQIGQAGFKHHANFVRQPFRTSIVSRYSCDKVFAPLPKLSLGFI